MERVTQAPILVPLDGSSFADQAIPYADALAGGACQLILLEVGEDEADEFALAERHAGACHRLETAVGDPADQILRAAEDFGAGMIVMTTHGRGALGRWAFGSVADKVTRLAPVPVLVVHPNGEDRTPGMPLVGRVVVPLDGSELAASALPAAEALARRLGLPIHLVSVVDADRLVPVELAPAAAFGASVIERDLADMTAAAREALASHGERLRAAGVTTTWAVWEGSPYLVLADALRPGDVVVMASRGQRGMARWLLGSVSEKLIREGPAPVLLIPAPRPSAASAVAPTGRKVNASY